MREFHIRGSIRQQIQFDESLFQMNGNVVFANFLAVRTFVQKLNQHRSDLQVLPYAPARASDVNAIGLIDEIFHYVIHLYQQQERPEVVEELLSHLQEQLGRQEVDRFLIAFLQEFPPTAVFAGVDTPQTYLESSQEGRPTRAAVLEEVLITWLANENPAYHNYRDLFDDDALREQTAYARITQEIDRFLKDQPGFGPLNSDLVRMLRSPALAEPRSISRQLEYIKRHWGYLLGDLLLRLLSSLDLLREEEKLTFHGPGPIEIPLYDISSLDLLGAERYSTDRDWMPNLVMVAKNTYVWLYQLEQQYHRPVRTLADIPDEALSTLAGWGINGLWLIGIWERSQASARIKQLTGNPEAISSAYALHDYEIAADLGGEAAYQDLNRRARRFGIRLASDMVPNHTAIDSRWVHEHPDWFIALPYSPFPAYTFTGPDLSNRPEMSLHIEDHYFDRTDAAVVFKRIDRSTGQELYIYHGNDGTSFPWNDTAQLNFLKPEVREAVIQNILQVAKRFQVIRFDAAMTLTRLHYHRLWYPEPGSGGDIPSRADHSLTTDEFNRAMPREFWREVVERVTAEAPDTLLLAEAFWLMESFFVRTLGMHRVYNSAFMNLLRDEANAKYRALMKNTLEFDPEILKRFVNFLNNPDERTAVDQFGKGDKYFGVTILMVTMPGLPMFGHGQVEGFTEKYGMEYRRAYRAETPDRDLLERHQREIFPLLHKRYLFAHVDHFLLYDFYTPDGGVNEDVYAYSNRSGMETTLVVYNNRFNDTQGWVHNSAVFMHKGGDQPQVLQRSLADGLSIQDDDRMFTIFRDHLTQLEYIRRNADIIRNGLHFDLHAYQAHVFMDFLQIRDQDGSLQLLHDHLGGRGASSIEFARVELALQPVLYPLRQLFDPTFLQTVFAASSQPSRAAAGDALQTDLHTRLQALREGLHRVAPHIILPPRWEKRILRQLQLGLQPEELACTLPARVAGQFQRILADIRHFLEANAFENRVILYSLILLNSLRDLGEDRFEEWRLERHLVEIYRNLQPLGNLEPARTACWVRLLVSERWQPLTGKQGDARETFAHMLTSPSAQAALGINEYQGVTWFSREAFEALIDWELVTSFLDTFSEDRRSCASAIEHLLKTSEQAKRMKGLAAQSNFQAAQLLNLL